MPNTSQFVQIVPEAFRACHRSRPGISPRKCVFPSDETLKPKSIGLGVFHQNVNSRDRQKDKETALTDALREMRRDRAELVHEVTQLLGLIKELYDAPDIDLMDPGACWAEDFAKDACYIIQFFADEDHMEAKFVTDIFIPSNQIPLFLLVKIMRMYRNPEGKMTEFVKGLVRYQPFETLCPLVVSREHNILNFLIQEIALARYQPFRTLHLLHLLHKRIANILDVPKDTLVMVGLTTPSLSHDVFKSLKEYNITFRERIGKVCFRKGLIFSSILYLPSIRLEGDRTVKFYKSLMAFDWISSDCNPICDLTFLLHLIVDDSNRKLFSKARIIQGGGERFCTNLNNIVRDLTEFYIGDEGYHGGVYRSVIDELDKHTQDFWNEWMYRARDWVILLALLALFAAIFFGVVNEIRK